MNYFSDCNTNDQAKNMFRDLCKKFHPDTSGYNSQSDFVKMFKEFKEFKPTQKSNDFDNKDFDKEEFYNMVKNFDSLQDIKVDFVGTFIWLYDLVVGATYEQKEKIKAIELDGYSKALFARKKKKWMFKPIDYKGSKSKGLSYDKIKSLHGLQNSYTPKGFTKIG